MDYLYFRELFHSSEIQREKAKLVSEFEIFNRDFFEDLPYRVRDVLDSLTWRFRQEEWFSEAWEKYRQHVLNAGLGGAIKMPGYVFKPYLERYVDEHPSQFNLSLDEAKCEAAYSDMEIGEYLEHHGIKGQKWGYRRYQNLDGSLTVLGKQHYNSSDNSSEKKKDYIDAEFHDIPKNNRKSEKRTADFIKKEKDKNASTISKKEHKKNVDDFINSFKKKETPKDDKSKDIPKKDNKTKDNKPKTVVEEKAKDNKSKNVTEEKSKDDNSKKDNSQSKKQNNNDTKGLQDSKDILNETRNLTESINRAIPKGETKKVYASYSNMTDQELQHEIKRLSSERALSDLRGDTQYIKSGRDKAKDILSGVGAGIGVATSALTLMILFKKLRSDKADSVEFIDEIVGNFLEHHGVKGMKWGQRRYQNPDGTLTDLGKKHYQTESDTPEGAERERVVKGTKDILDKTPKYDKTVRKQEKEYMKYAKKAGAKEGAVTGMLIGGIAGATAATIKDVYNDKYKKGSTFVADIAYGALEGVLGGAFLGSLIGKRAGKKSAQAHLANRGKQYTDKLLSTPVNRIDSR